MQASGTKGESFKREAPPVSFADVSIYPSSESIRV
jgi:hypothetical protein